LCEANGIQFISFPIIDRTTPSSKEAFVQLMRRLEKQIQEGRNLAIHCRQGIGRAALVAICLLISGGLTPQTAIQQVSAARGCSVPETLEQTRWIVEFAKSLLATPV
jgi:protein-tyrosine phosphatase